jgi:hypothetical protein
MQKMRIFQLLLSLTALAISFSHGELRAEPKENTFQTYQFEALDLQETEMKLTNLANQFGFIQANLLQERKAILAMKKSNERKKLELFNSAANGRNKILGAFRPFLFEPYYGDQNWAQAQARIKTYPSVYKAWFKALAASHSAEVEIFESYYLIGETAYANKALTKILESGNSNNIVMLSKQARLYFKSGNSQAARQLLAQVEARKKTEAPESLYLPDYAGFIWTPAERKAKLASALQQYQKEVLRLKKWK